MDVYLITVVGCMCGAFAICGIPFGLIFAQRMNGVDVREVGSGNIGMTNVARSAGASAAALTFACDVGKGTLSMFLARWLISQVLLDGVTLDVTAPGFAALTLVYASCLLGHIFSPYLNFHGGKGISVGFGAALGLYWPVALVLLACFLVMAIPTRYISLGSIVSAVLLPVQCLFLWHMTTWAVIPVTAVSALVIWAHRGNITKLLSGQESHFSIKHTDANDRQRRRRVPPTQRREDGEE